MTDQEKLEQFVKDVYLVRFNRDIDLTTSGGLKEITKTLSFARMFLQEIQSERNPDGSPINWHWARTNDRELGVVATPSQVFTLPDSPVRVRRLVVDEDRPLVLMFDGSIISTYETVEANQITRRRLYPSTEDRVASVKRSLVFSRPFKDYEIGATVVCDTIDELTPITAGVTPNVDLLDVIPYNLLVLGTAKNSIRPDIVQGGLAPSFIEQYADELDKAIAENNATSISDEVVTEDFSGIGGIF
jgi:hypothetical protein